MDNSKKEFTDVWDVFCVESHHRAVKEFNDLCNVIGLKRYRKDLEDIGHKRVAEIFYNLGRSDKECKVLKEENKKMREALKGNTDSNMKAVFIGEYHFSVKCNDENGNEYLQKHTIPWTLQKYIFRDMCRYRLKQITSNTI